MFKPIEMVKRWRLPRSRLVAMYFVFIAVLLVDLGRVLWPPSAQPADEVAPSWFYRPARLLGLPHTEHVRGYQIETYWSHRGIPIGKPDKVDPFVLIPLNIQERSEGRLVMVEFPMGQEFERPDVSGLEFSGLLGPIPDDLLRFLGEFNASSQPRPMRLQPKELPSPWISLSGIIGAVLMLRFARWIERGGLRPTFLSRLLFAAGALPAVLLLLARLRFDPAANMWTTWATTMFFHAIIMAAGMAIMRVPRPDYEATASLTDEMYAAASALHERMNSNGR